MVYSSIKTTLLHLAVH
uniref:Uncharacterized protein n=1 Tax=Anguilla anguilla TaxID=7936 RepID=A0A0E9W1U7_ANGAN